MVLVGTYSVLLASLSTLARPGVEFRRRRALAFLEAAVEYVYPYSLYIHFNKKSSQDSSGPGTAALCIALASTLSFLSSSSEGRE